MSFVTMVKDTTEFVKFLGQEPFPEALSQFFSWCLENFLSFISFKWLVDIPLLPIFMPRLSTQVIEEGINIGTSEQSVGTLGFFLPDVTGWNKLIPGILNSFFLVLPFSPARILWIRRLIIQGIPAGVFSGLGLIVGQVLFLIIVLFGLRPFIYLWSSLEPLSYLIGLVWFLILFDRFCSKKAPRVEWEDSKLGIKLFLETLFLGCVEQTTLGQYISSLTTTGESFVNEGFNSSTQGQFYLSQSTYLIGIIFGLVVFGGALGWLIWHGSRFWYQTSTLPYKMWEGERVNPILILLFGSTVLSSVPYYSWDYLFAKPLGFTPDDKSLDLLTPSWIGTKADAQLPKWRDYYQRVSEYEPGVLGDGYSWSRYDQAEYPASLRRRAVEAMLINHEWFPHWAKDCGLLTMEYSPASSKMLKRFSLKLASLSLPDGNRIRTFIWNKDRRERIIQRDAIRAIKNWFPGRTQKLNVFWKKLKVSQGLERSDLLQASRFLTFGRLRFIPKSTNSESNIFVDAVSKRTLGNDPIEPMVSSWTEQSRLKNRINYLDKEFLFSSKEGGFPFNKKNRTNSVFDLWVATRSQVLPEFESKRKDFEKIHKYWVVRNLLKPRFVQWRLKPSEENYVWMAQQGKYDKNFRTPDVDFLIEQGNQLKNNESNLLRLQHYLEVGKQLSGELGVSRSRDLKTLEPGIYNEAFKPLQLKNPPINDVGTIRNSLRFRRNVIKQNRLESRFRNKRFGSENFNVPLTSRSFIFGGSRPYFLQIRQSQRKGDRRLWRRRVPMRPSPVGPSRWSSFNYFRQKVYHRALSYVVDNVMKGQPKEYFLTTQEEQNLAKRKVQLARYYDSLRSYKNSPRFRRFVPGGSRTFTDGVYNHQFKGTLSYARRLFYVTQLEAQNMEGGKVYKMSQLLYDKDKTNPMLHEELQVPSEKQQPFLQLMPSPSPFYTGWDGVNHKMILTTRTLPRDGGAGYRVPPMEDSFTAWPYSLEKIREIARPKVYDVRSVNQTIRPRLRFGWLNDLRVGFSWRTQPRKKSWYQGPGGNPVSVNTPLGYWARAQHRFVFPKKVLIERRWNRWYLRIPALPRLGGFSWDA